MRQSFLSNLKFVLQSAFFFLFQSALLGQGTQPCPAGNISLSDDCASACYICDFAGVDGNNEMFTVTGAPGFCSTEDNSGWLAFVAGSQSISFTILPNNCQNGQGLQAAIYANCASAPLACDQGTGSPAPINISANGLTAGQIYYLMLDGWNGDICDFTIQVVPSGAATAPMPPLPTGLNGTNLGCLDSVYTYAINPIPGATHYTWFVQGANINGLSQKETIQGAAGTSVSVTFPTAGNYSVCVWGGNVCNIGQDVCIPVIIEDCPPAMLCDPVFEYIIGDCGEVQLLNQTPPPAVVNDWAITGPNGYFNIISGNTPIVNLPYSGSYTVTLTVTCDGGNTLVTHSETFNVTKDDTAPVFGNCPTSQTYLTLAPNCLYSYVIPVITASDNAGGTSISCVLSGNVVQAGDTVLLPVGTHGIVCTAIDDCGNEEICEYAITVECQQVSPCDSAMVMVDTTCACIDSSIITGNPCITVYDPVCGCDGNTYSNACFATEAGIPLWKAGECSPNNPPPSVAACDSCCYTLDLKVPTGLSKVCFDMLTPGVIFNSASLNAASLQIDTAANGRQICIQDNIAGRPKLTAGVYDDFMKICLGNVTDPSQYPQCVEVTYLIPSPIDGFDVLCRDTLKFYCEPVEIGADSCVSVVADSVICDPNDPTRFMLVMTACNLSAFTAGNLNITSQDPTINFWPCNYPLNFPAPAGSISIPFSPQLSASNCQQICVDVVSNTPITGPYTFQMTASLWSTDTCCTAPAIFDATLKPCCDPCDEKGYTSTDVSGVGGTKTVAFTSVKDGFTVNTQASYGDGTSAYMQAGFVNVGSEVVLYNAFLDFDFKNTLCADAQITNAELRLFANPTSSGHADNLLSNSCWKLQRVTSPWAEASLFADNPQGTTSNELSVNAPTSALQDYNLNVTQLVQDMWANPSGSHGFKLTTTCNHDHSFNFATREYLTQALRPTLVITYDDTACDSLAFGECCHAVDVQNDCDKDFFTKIEVESATAGVIISSHYTGGSSPTDWSNPKSTATCVQWTHTSGFIPTGISAGVVNFCLGDIDPGETPQIVYLKWYTTDQNGMDSIACVDTLTYDCLPPVDNDCITVMDIQPKGDLCDSIDCYNNPFCLPWLRDMISNSLAGGCPTIGVFSSFEVAYYNGSPVIIGHKTGGTPHGNSDWVFSCNGDTIQYCYDWLGGYDCDPDAGIDFTTDLTGVSTIWTCPQALPALPTNCNSGSSSTPSMTYCVTIKNSSSPPHFATDLLLGSATSGVSIFPNSIPLPNPGLAYCGITTVTFTVFGTIAPGDTIKIYARLHDAFTGDDWCCFDADTICLPVPPCPQDTAQCCTDFDAFCDLVDLGWAVTYLDSCTVEVTANQFDSCHYFSTVGPDWGDGSITLPTVVAANGTFTHKYATPGTYPICITVFEGDGNGNICWEKLMCDTVTVDCDTVPTTGCCTDFDAFCDLVDLGWAVTYLDSCTVEVTANQFDSCHYFSTVGPDWGDGSITLPTVVPANGTFTHKYATPGTYPICITVFEGDGNGNICWEKLMCDTVTVDCDTMTTTGCCAISDSAFCALFENGMSFSLNDCAICFPLQLDSCDEVTVDYGDGTTVVYDISSTNFCHTYTAPGGGFVVNVSWKRLDAMGNICHEKDTIFDIFTDCPPIGSNCCAISDSAFCVILETGINHTVDMCTVCLPFQLDSCDQLTVHWGDSRSNVYGIGQNICHSYPPSLGNWTVTATLRRFDATGQLCKEKDSTFTVQTNCPPVSETCPACPNGASTGINLVQNGDFSLGNTGFTSSHTYQGTGILGEGDYSIRTATALINGQWANVGHTTATATDPFLVIDGPFATAAYSTTINVLQDSSYQLCFYANNLVRTATASNPSIEVVIDGIIEIPATPLPKTPDNWVLFSSNFTATTTGTIIISIFDRNPNKYNDWAIDDVSVVQCSGMPPITTCCTISDSAFCAILDNTLQFTEDSCEICFTNALTPCDSLVIDFGDGTTDSYTAASPAICHQYNQPGGTFTVTAQLTRFDSGDMICKQKDSTFTITTNCIPSPPDSCCVNQAAFQTLVNQGWTVTYGDSCSVTVSANQFTSCHWFGTTAPDWGDGTGGGGTYIPANGTYTHTYATPGTYTICMTVFEGPSTDSLCYAAPMCVPVTVDCCDNICDSLSITANPDPMSGDTCCYIVQMENNYCQANYFKGISIQTQAPTTISQLSGLNGWIINQFSATHAEVYPSGGAVPNGILDIFKICTDNYVTVPHFVDVSWLVPNGAGGCDTICPTTLEFDCAVPPTPVSCVEITEDSIDCTTGRYCFKIKNTSTPGFAINQVDLINISPSTAALTPNPIAIPLLASGQTSGWICTNYTGINAGDTLCYNLTAHFVNAQGQALTCCTDTVTHCIEIPDCPSCCADFDSFCDLVDLGWAVTYGDSCTVTVTATQFDSCHLFGSLGPDWGDGSVTLPTIIPANGSWTHTYATPGTYPVCITVFEGDDPSNFCWDKMMCDTVTVDCCQGNICDSLSIAVRPDIVNGDTCCHIVEMTNTWCGSDTLLGFTMRTQNPAIFNQLSTLPGWNITQFSSSMITVRRLGGTPIPQGTLDVFSVCTDNYSTTPHEIEIAWLLKTGQLAAEICPDTLEFSCGTPPPSRPCVLIVQDSFDCQNQQYCFKVSNNSTPGFTINEVQFVNISPTGASLSPNPIPVPPLAAGQTSGWICTTYSGLNQGDTLCVNVVGHQADSLGNYLTCCTDTVTHCTVVTCPPPVGGTCCDLTQMQYDSLLSHILYLGQDSTTCEVCLDYEVDSCDVLVLDFGDGSPAVTIQGYAANTLCHVYGTGGLYQIGVQLLRYNSNGDTCLMASKNIAVDMYCPNNPPTESCCSISQADFDTLLYQTLNYTLNGCEICWSGQLDSCDLLSVDYGDGTMLNYMVGDTLCYTYTDTIGMYAPHLTLTRLDANGNICRMADTTLALITIQCSTPVACNANMITIFNALTPNDGDNLNNQLIIEKPPVCGKMHIKIYNRWGQMVWQQSDYDNTWSGRSIQEEDLPDGTYYLIVEFPDAGEKPIRMQKFIDLRRD